MEIDEVEEPVRTALAARGTVPMDELPAFFAEAFGRCVEAATVAGLKIAGAPFAWYPSMPTDTIEVVAGMPVEGPIGELPSGVELIDRPGGQAIAAMHVGPYDTLRDTYVAMEEWLSDRRLEAREGPWEEYLTDPGAEPDSSRWQTRIVMPVGSTDG